MDIDILSLIDFSNIDGPDKKTLLFLTNSIRMGINVVTNHLHV